MDQDLAFRESRIGWPAAVGFGVVGLALYAAANYLGSAVVYGVSGMTVGYLFARLTEF